MSSSYLQEFSQPLSSAYGLGDTNHDPLRLEPGWRDVASGLGRMLSGYCVGIGVITLAILVGVFFAANPQLLRLDENGRPNLTGVWILTLTGGVVTLGTLASYFLILTGQLRCAINAPERCGARWLIFLCMVCLVAGPAISIALNLSQVAAVFNDPQKSMRQMLEQTQEPQVRVVHLIGPAINLTTMILFVLFLRSIGSCFNQLRLISAVDMFLTYTAVLAGFTLFLMFNVSLMQQTPMLGMVLVGSWGVASLIYFLLVLFARTIIQRGMDSIRSPLEAA